MAPITADEVRKGFPRMPDEVFNLWLRPEVERAGWPQEAEEVILLSPSWNRHLRGYKPSLWAAVSWRQSEFTLASTSIEERAFEVALALATQYNTDPSSRPRVGSLLSCLRESRSFPKPLVFYASGEQWLLLDGQHRLAALSIFGTESSSLRLAAWVAENAL